jgi:hypothetical protein
MTGPKLFLGFHDYCPLDGFGPIDAARLFGRLYAQNPGNAAAYWAQSLRQHLTWQGRFQHGCAIDVSDPNPNLHRYYFFNQDQPGVPWTVLERPQW